MAIKSDISESRTPADIVKTLRSGIGPVSEEVIEEIQARIPEYARPSDEIYIKVVRMAVEQAIEGFLDRIERPDAPWDPEPFRMIGKGEAAEGRNLEPLQAAMRLGARVGWRRLTELAGPLGLSPQSLYDLGEAIFVYLDQLADAAAEGFDEARAHAAGEMERRRARLLDLLLSRPPASPDAIADLAKAAAWRLPRTVACVALDDQYGTCRLPPLPPDVLTGPSRPVPCLLVPDPAGPGRAQLLEHALRGHRAAIGPAVPLASAATSLRWAGEALVLSRRGVLPRGLLRCADHLATLVVFKDEELVSALAEVRLAPLAHLRPTQQDRLAETLLAWLRHGRGAGEVAAKLHVHPQTVRYRLRQLEELYGDQLADPDIRFELEIALRARQAVLAAR
ncbi:regulatory protein [[Actinomadura] parvosata subsp. kistnae]|uniref:PucR family transcriptional regulator n=1 Tax=[Actinomadura] parvosata subsp. kistnae TaxID=1909395 RepID=A0A1V0ADW0_9ACTN|nr:helix-turn-helix domain-containing protein [Nonomuraea sp. ATCC 55076]AQZ68411.1 PucR family transcriptional regulator [Nonomuraea sp. ATCC 55076]SPL93146.1 regulatory protein [Actinomadura parvosata subsp. kistnae]